MPLFSAFTPLGMLAFSGRPSHAESLYRTIRSNLGGDGVNFSFTAGSREDAWSYMVAMGLARAQYKLDDAANQSDSRRVTWFLKEREEEYGISPGPTDDVPTRQAAVTAARQLPGGGTKGALYTGLSTMLGARFLGIHYTTAAERVKWPTNLGDQPQALKLPATPPQVYKLLQPVTFVGSPVTVQYIGIDSKSPVDLKSPAKLIVGDRVVVGAESSSLAEAVTVAATGTVFDFTKTFTATFTKAHDLGALVTTQPYAPWVTNQRQVIVVVTPATATDPEWRRKVNEFMRKAVGSTTIWAVVAGSGGVAGPFTLGSPTLGILGATPFGTVPYP